MSAREHNERAEGGAAAASARSAAAKRVLDHQRPSSAPLALARWTFAALGALFLGIQPKAACGVCGERCRDVVAHLARTQCGSGYWA